MRHATETLTARAFGTVTGLVSSVLFFAAVFVVAAGAVFATGVVAGPVIGKASLLAVHGTESRVIPDRWDDSHGEHD